MQISTPSALARTAPPPPADNAAADAAGGGFANLLQQQAEPAAPDAAGDERPETSTNSSRETRPRTPTRQTARPPERAAASPVDPKTEAGAQDAPAAVAGDDDAPDHGLLDWLAALHLPAPAAPAADAAVAPGAEPALAAGAMNAPDPLAAATRPLADTADAGTALQAAGPPRVGARDKANAGGRGATTAPDAATETAPSRAAAEPAEGRRFSIEGLATPRSGAAPEATPLTSQFAPPAGPAQNAAPAPIAVPLATPLDDPQFPRAFGVQVSVLARDGVQQAELHLNPAEMGPVSVQIVMDGTQARIDFGADAAGTRQLIEHSLPHLAAALREAGLTLTGGGVSQHPSGRDGHDGQAPSGRPADPSAGAAETPTAPLRRSVRAGGVDLYA